MKPVVSLARVVAALSFVAFAACDSPTGPRPIDEISGGTANEAATTACPGNSGGDCQMAVSINLGAPGNATLVVRTGTYDEATGQHVPNGTFEKVQWKIYSPTGKLVATKNSDASGTVFETSLTSPFDVGYRVEVQANIRNHSGKKGTAVVRASAIAAARPTIDLELTSFERLVVGSPALAAPNFGEVIPGTTNSFVATISSPANSATATATCNVTLNGSPASGSQINWITQQVTLAGGETGQCQFSLTLPAGSYLIGVTATSPSDPTAGNNTKTGTLVVRAAPPSGAAVDVAAQSIQLWVDGEPQQSSASIPKGKSGYYVVTFVNKGTQTANFDCAVTAAVGALAPVTLGTATENPITIPAGEAANCEFGYTFTTLASVTFVASAVLPLDENPADNSITATTAAVSDNTFPAIESTNVHALQRWDNDENGTPIYLNEQTTSINRITLTFAATNAIIGSFTLSGVVKSGGNLVSSATWTVPSLGPGIGTASNCVAGVDPGVVSPANHIVTLKICAQAVAGDPSVQAIYVEYESVLPGVVTNPSPAIMFGSEITFAVALDWTLFGSSVSDRACAELGFALLERNLGPRYPTSYTKTQTGAVTVIRNGSGC